MPVIANPDITRYVYTLCDNSLNSKDTCSNLIIQKSLQSSNTRVLISLMVYLTQMSVGHAIWIADGRLRFWRKIFLGTPNNGGQAKNLYTKSDRVAVSCRVTGIWGLKELICTVGR